MDRRISIRLAAIAVLFALTLLPATARAVNILERQALKGLTSVRVIVDITDNDGLLRQYADTSLIQTRMELRLRQSGVPVIDSPVAPNLALGLQAMSFCSGNVLAIECQLSLNQTLWKYAYPVRNNVALSGATWRHSWLLGYDLETMRQNKLNEAIDEIVDEFLNDWLATHPKK